MEQLSNSLEAKKDDLNKADLKPSMQQVIEWVRNNRNSKIKSFGEKSIVVHFFLENYSVNLSDRKYEFLSRELTELLITPVDLAHYAAVITDFKESKSNAGLDQDCERLVMQELAKIFKKYIF
jgi:hypothetical protein